MDGPTLFLVDADASVGGIARSLGDLVSLGAGKVSLERLQDSTLELSLERIAELGRAGSASLVVVGLSDGEALGEIGMNARAALPDHPTLYLGVGSHSSPMPNRGTILSHVLVPADYSVRSGCLAACLRRVAAKGARTVTLMHVPDVQLGHACSNAVGEMGRVDMEWIDQLQRMTLRAGVQEVNFLCPPAGGAPGLDMVEPSVTLVLVGGTCNEEIARAYIASAQRLFARGADVPALMLTPESCAEWSRDRGAA